MNFLSFLLDYNGLIIGFSLCGKFFISLQVVTVSMMTAELFPTPARGITVALCSTVAKIGGILSPVLSVLVRYIVKKKCLHNYVSR